jgi:hypothetical protein
MTFTPQLIVACIALVIVGAFGVAGTVDGTTALGMISSLVAGFGLGTYHANGNGGGRNGKGIVPHRRLDSQHESEPRDS